MKKKAKVDKKKKVQPLIENEWKNNKYIYQDDDGNLWYSIPFQKALQLLLRKGIIAYKDIPVLDDTSDGFDFRQLTRLTLFNNEIVSFLYSSTPNFAIYDSLEGGDLIISAKEELLITLNESVPDIITMKSQLSKRDRRRFHLKVAGGMRLCLMGRGKAAKGIFKEITKKINESRRNMFRLIYLSGSITIFLLLLILALLFKLEDLDISFSWNMDKLLNLLLFSSIGGIFSVLHGYRSIKADIPEAGQFNYYINGMSRIVISLLAGIVAYEFIMGDFILTNIKTNPYVLNCVAILAGFTETFIPGVLKKTTAELEKDPN